MSGSKHIEIPSRGVAALIGFAAQEKSTAASALHTLLLPFGLNPGDATGTQRIVV